MVQGLLVTLPDVQRALGCLLVLDTGHCLCGSLLRLVGSLSESWLSMADDPDVSALRLDLASSSSDE